MDTYMHMDTCIHMDRKKDWVVDVENELNKVDENTSIQTKLWKNQSVYKVPTCVSDLNKKAYKPQVVSFGPYHHDDNHLKPMESHKDRAVLQFLKRSKQSLEKIYQSFSLPDMVRSLKANYDSLGEYDDDKFLKMIILDGCFLIEILLAWNSKHFSGYSESDPIFSEHGRLYMMPFTRRDMLMLENQLPMMVLDTLVSSWGDDQKINNLILEFYGIQPKNVGKCMHVLDVVRKSMIIEGPPIEEVGNESKEQYGAKNGEIVLSAIELDDAGIKFKKSASRSLRNISFQGGILRLPEIVIGDNTESMFLNLIAFERCHVGAGNAISSYVCFMDSLVDSGRDIKLLHSKKIVWNVMGSNDAAANLFNTMSMDLTIDPNSDLSKVHCKINNYCKNTWHKHRANLNHTYFRSPWAIFSVIAASLLFVLTITQTIFSILDYKFK